MHNLEEAKIEVGGTEWLAIVAAIIANMVIGFVWYNRKVFGSLWAQYLGMPADMKPKPGEMAKAMGLMVVGSLLTMYVLVHVMLAFTPSTWFHDSDDAAGLGYAGAAMGALFVWLGFFLPPVLGSMSWERRPLGLVLINGGYHLVTLQVAGAIFVMMGIGE